MQAPGPRINRHGDSFGLDAMLGTAQLVAAAQEAAVSAFAVLQKIHRQVQLRRFWIPVHHKCLAVTETNSLNTRRFLLKKSLVLLGTTSDASAMQLQLVKKSEKSIL